MDLPSELPRAEVPTTDRDRCALQQHARGASHGSGQDPHRCRYHVQLLPMVRDKSANSRAGWDLRDYRIWVKVNR